MTLDGKFCLICEKRRGVERESEGVKEREKREREKEEAWYKFQNGCAAGPMIKPSSCEQQDSRERKIYRRNRIYLQTQFTQHRGGTRQGRRERERERERERVEVGLQREV